MTRSIERQLIGGVWTTVDAEESGGGGGPITGFAVHTDTDYNIGNGGRWHPSVTDYLSGWSADPIEIGRYVSDPDAAGLYIVECGLVFTISSGGPADEVWGDIIISSTAWNVDPISFDCQEVPNAISADVWRGHGGAMLELGAGCSVSVEVSRHPYGAMTTAVSPQTFLRVFKLGDLV